MSTIKNQTKDTTNKTLILKSNLESIPEYNLPISSNPRQYSESIFKKNNEKIYEDTKNAKYSSKSHLDLFKTYKFNTEKLEPSSQILTSNEIRNSSKIDKQNLSNLVESYKQKEYDITRSKQYVNYLEKYKNVIKNASLKSSMSSKIIKPIENKFNLNFRNNSSMTNKKRTHSEIFRNGTANPFLATEIFKNSLRADMEPTAILSSLEKNPKEELQDLGNTSQPQIPNSDLSPAPIVKIDYLEEMKSGRKLKNPDGINMRIASADVSRSKKNIIVKKSEQPTPVQKKTADFNKIQNYEKHLRLVELQNIKTHKGRAKADKYQWDIIQMKLDLLDNWVGSDNGSNLDKQKSKHMAVKDSPKNLSIKNQKAKEAQNSIQEQKYNDQIVYKNGVIDKTKSPEVKFVLYKALVDYKNTILKLRESKCLRQMQTQGTIRKILQNKESTDESRLQQEEKLIKEAQFKEDSKKQILSNLAQFLKTNLATKYYFAVNLIHCKAQIGRDNKNRINKTSDPFVVINLHDDQQILWSPKLNTSNPIWKEIKTFSLDSNGGRNIPVLDIKVFDNELLGHTDDCAIGKVSISTEVCISKPNEWGINKIFALKGDENMFRVQNVQYLGEIYQQVLYSSQPFVEKDLISETLTVDLEKILNTKSERMGTFVCHLVHGKELAITQDPKTNSNRGIISPYAVVKFPGKRNQKSKVKENTINPIWQERYVQEIKIAKNDFSPIRIEIYDKFQNKDVQVGLCELDTTPQYECPGDWLVDANYALKNTNITWMQNFGEVYLQARYQEYGVPDDDIDLPQISDNIADLVDQYDIIGKIDIKITALRQPDTYIAHIDPYQLVTYPNGKQMKSRILYNSVATKLDEFMTQTLFMSSSVIFFLIKKIGLQ